MAEPDYDAMHARAWETGFLPKQDETAGFSEPQRMAIAKAAFDGAGRNHTAAAAKARHEWAGDRPARRYFQALQPRSKAEERQLEEIEQAIHIVEEHYSKLDPTPHDPLHQIKINENDHDAVGPGKPNYEAGIRIYRHAYEEMVGTVHVGGIVGPHNLAIEGDGRRSVELEPGARTFMLRVAFTDGPPSREDMIDDLCALPLSESKPIKRNINWDLGTIPVHPNARDLEKELISIAGGLPASERVALPAAPVVAVPLRKTTPVSLPLPSGEEPATPAKTAAPQLSFSF